MSTYWDIHCVTCGTDAGFDTKALDHVRLIIDSASALAAFADAPVADEATINHWAAGNLSPAWFKAHAGHKLVAKNEYGDLDGECAKSFGCKCCGHRRRCSLPEGHEGECARASP